MEFFFYLKAFAGFGIASLGFAVLFNAPVRTLLYIVLLGALGGITKLILVENGFNLIFATFFAATFVGTLSHAAGWLKSAPPIVFSIPASIPMIPGIYLYKMMIGLIKLGNNNIDNAYASIASETLHNGLLALFTLLSLALGAALPLLIVRKKSSKELKDLINYKKD